MSELISREAALDCFRDWIDRYGNEHTADEDAAYQRIAELPAVQPDHTADISKKVSISCGQENDLISRKAAIEAIEKIAVNERDTDRGFLIFCGLSAAITVIDDLPSVQPEQRWIPVTERLPENDNEVLITVWDAEDDYVEVYKGFHQGHEWWTQWCHGCSKIKDEPCGENIVIAWMPLPEPYKGDDVE